MAFAESGTHVRLEQRRHLNDELLLDGLPPRGGVGKLDGDSCRPALEQRGHRPIVPVADELG
jgi:hypothetical protein